MKVKASKTINLSEIDIKLIAFRPDDKVIEIRWEENGKRNSLTLAKDDFSEEEVSLLKKVFFGIIKKIDFVTETKNPIELEERRKLNENR